jgi:hypothetical protein
LDACGEEVIKEGEVGAAALLAFEGLRGTLRDSFKIRFCKYAN